MANEHEESFFYFISKGKFLICDLEFCSQTERTFHMSLFDLANNEKLLDKLGLYYMQGNYGVKYNYVSRAKWFCGYLAAFNNKEDERHAKMITNPPIRLMIEDDALLAEVKNILGAQIEIF
jgi:hypothetical protein